MSWLKIRVRKGRATNDGADLSEGRVFVTSVLDEQNMRSVLYPTPSYIPAAGARYTPPTTCQQGIKSGQVRRTGSSRYEGEYSPLYSIFGQVCT